MPIIQCPDCGGNVSDKASACIHCGCPLTKQEGKAIFKASSDFIGLACNYHIMDENKNILTKLKPGESYEETIPEDCAKLYYVKLAGNLSSAKEVICTANEINRFNLSPGQLGLGIAVSKVDMLDSKD